MEQKEQTKNAKKFISNSSKLNFFFGLIVGIAIIAIIGLVALIVTRNNSANLKPAQKNTNQQAVNQPKDQKVDLKINADDLVLGNRNAPIKIFEFSDFQCPYCARFHPVMHKIIKTYGDKVAWIFKQFPLASHPLGMPAAIASECANEQGKFWKFSDMVYTNQKKLTSKSFEQFAQELGLNMDQYKTCVSEEKYKNKILTDYNLGIKSGVRGTPTNFINNQKVPGAVPYESMKEIIDSLLK